jgi:hypothetical protein
MSALLFRKRLTNGLFLSNRGRVTTRVRPTGLKPRALPGVSDFECAQMKPPLLVGSLVDRLVNRSQELAG